MSNPTSNFNWQMPTSSDLVTDLPADFEVFGQAVDTTLADLKGGTTGQVLKKNSNTDMDFVWSSDATGMTNPMTTTGDTIYSSSGSTPARLGIGTTGQILTVSGGLPTWASPSAASDDFSLLNTGGTTLTGADTVTISGISGKGTIFVLVKDASSVDANSSITVRINGVSASSYQLMGARTDASSSWSTSNMTRYGITDSAIYIGTMSSAANSTVAGYVKIEGANSSGTKMFTNAGGANGGTGGAGHQSWVGGGWLATTAVTSVSIYSTSGNLDGGTVWVYASA